MNAHAIDVFDEIAFALLKPRHFFSDAGLSLDNTCPYTAALSA
jgi:hypothetical protein